MKHLLFIAIALFSFIAAKADTTTVNVVLAAGENIKTDSIKVLDKVTNNQINATVTSVAIQNSNAAVATVSYLSRVVKVTRVSAGSGTAILTCRVSYTDPGDGLQKSEDKTIIINYSVVGTAHGITLQLFN